MLTQQSITHFFSKVAGVSYNNFGGTSRQEIIQKCACDEQVYLEREPDNRYDPQAVRVVRETNEQLGYLPAGLAEGVTVGLREGVTYVAFIQAILEPNDTYNLYGLALLVVEVPPTTTQEDFLTYIMLLRMQFLY